MRIQPGRHALGPPEATLTVKTGRTGAAAKAGHNLLILVGAWEGTLSVGDDGAPDAIALTADAGSLRVLEGSGGLQPLGEDDKAGIRTTIDDDVLRRRSIAFRSTGVRAAGGPAAAGGGGRIDVDGELELGGRAQPIAFALMLAPDGRLGGSAIVKQSDFGIKPYSTLFGTLKVVDEVEVAIDARLPCG